MILYKYRSAMSEIHRILDAASNQSVANGGKVIVAENG